MEKLYAVGHITNDLSPSPHIGGAVTYAAMAFRKLGGDAAVITKLQPNHPYVDELQKSGIEVFNLPIRDDRHAHDITSFWNTYDKAGNRSQKVSTQQESIRQPDLRNFPVIEPGSLILVAPVIGEVDSGLLEQLSQNHKLIVAPQGYFRQAGPDGEIRNKAWGDIDNLRSADLVILSDEDLTFDKKFSTKTLQQIQKLCGKVVMTQGTKGLTVFQASQEPIKVSAFGLNPNEVISPTGAGDSCAAAFVWHYYSHGDVKQAAVFAALYPALKLLGLSAQRGIAALPSLDQVKEYRRDNPKRVSSFLASNALNDIKL